MTKRDLADDHIGDCSKVAIIQSALLTIFLSKKMMMEKITSKNRTEYIPRVRLTQSEKLHLLQAFEQSYHTSMAAFVREKLFEKEVSSYQKMKIDALLELGQFQKELSRVGNNINQVAKALNTYKQGEMRLTERQMMQELIPLFHQIMNRLEHIRF